MTTSWIVGCVLAAEVGIGALANATAAAGHKWAACGLIVLAACVGAGVLAVM